MPAPKPDTGLNGYQRMTKDIIDQAEAAGCKVVGEWHDTLPYTDDQGEEHDEFYVEIQDDTGTVEALSGGDIKYGKMKLAIVHTYPRN